LILFLELERNVYFDLDVHSEPLLMNDVRGAGGAACVYSRQNYFLMFWKRLLRYECAWQVQFTASPTTIAALVLLISMRTSSSIDLLPALTGRCNSFHQCCREDGSSVSPLDNAGRHACLVLASLLFIHYLFTPLLLIPAAPRVLHHVLPQLSDNGQCNLPANILNSQEKYLTLLSPFISGT
jgi:hypothetical protein